jgi:hypothetical protein
MEEPMTETEPAIACTLTAADLAVQREDWRRLRTAAQIGREDLEDGARLRFRAGAGVAEELGRLAAIENECCSWASWAVRVEAGQAVLEVRSAGAGIAAAREVFR